MKHKIKNLPHSQIELEVWLDLKEFEEFWKPAYEAAASAVAIKGFRPGSAPKEMVDSVLDHDKVFQEALKKAVKKTLAELTDQNDWTLIDQPKVEVLDAKDSVHYKATLTLFPDIKLGNYKKIAKKIFSNPPQVTVSDEEVEKTLKWLANSRATEVRAAHAANKGDLVEVDVEARVDGKPLEGASFKGDRFVLGESHFLKGFDDQILGHKEGEELKFSITAPKDYWQTQLREKLIDFSVKLTGVFDRQVPAIDDAFAKTLGPNFKTVADLNKSAKEGLTAEKKEREKEKLRIRVLDEIAKNSTMDAPEIMIERTLTGMVEDMKKMVPRESSTTEEQHDKNLRENLRKRAKENVDKNLVVFQIAKEEKLEPTPQELEKEAAQLGVDLENGYDYSYGRVQNEKVLTFLENQANETQNKE